MDGIVSFIANIANFFGDTWKFLTNVVEVIQALYKIVVSFCSFFPTPFREMTLFTVGIIFTLTIWRLKR